MSSPKRAKLTSKDDGTNESEYLKSIQAVERFQEEMRVMQSKFDREFLKLEHKLEIDKKPIYSKREEAIRQIPNFWVTALMNHPDISDLLDESEEEYLLYLSKLEVKIDAELENTFRIIFHFKENPYFKNTSIVKEYLNILSDDKSMKHISASVIMWKEGQDISEKLKERKSFLFWLTSDDYGVTDIDVAQVIKDEIWTNPLPYYLLSDSQNEENSEEDDDNDDVLIIEDSDDDKSGQEEPEEEESENDSDDYDSPESSEVTQNDN